jgi:3-deoxy-D-manno-octulosonate 8-phosphate phosphatase (KDO 8-P phosphatase)
MIDARLAQRIRLVGFDVDGVLTDNGIYVGPVGGEPVELKRFHIQDGLGQVLLRTAGLAAVWVTGRPSEATAQRARELGVELIQVAGAQKVAALAEILAREEIAWEHVAFVGDDLADLPVLRRVGLPIAVANAVAEVKATAAYVTRTPGGQGAAREAVEMLLKARGVWDEILERYFLEQTLRVV